MYRLVLPGSTLAYGCTDSTSKGVALLWAIWLVAGPTEADIAYVCSKFRSLTTGFGTEVHLLETLDITAAFVAWIGGAPLEKLRPLVNHGVRLFPNALRIAGWSHAFGNIMKAIAESFGSWPKFLAHLRALCKSFRNRSYREHIKRRLNKFQKSNVCCAHLLPDLQNGGMKPS